MPKGELPRDIDVRARRQGRPLGTDQDVTKVELDLVFDVHPGLQYAVLAAV
jgi:sirohydrochlorin ferrochelatase